MQIPQEMSRDSGLRNSSEMIASVSRKTDVVDIMAQNVPVWRLSMISQMKKLI